MAATPNGFACPRLPSGPNRHGPSNAGRQPPVLETNVAAIASECYKRSTRTRALHGVKRGPGELRLIRPGGESPRESHRPNSAASGQCWTASELLKLRAPAPGTGLRDPRTGCRDERGLEADEDYQNCGEKRRGRTPIPRIRQGFGANQDPGHGGNMGGTNRPRSCGVGSA